MSIQVTMPALGESVTEGTVTRWLKNVGDTVRVDEPLLEVSTDKVDTEIPSPASGVLLEIVAPTDSTIAVGGVVAIIGAEGSAPAPAAAAAPAPAPVAAPSPTVTPAPAAAPAPTPSQTSAGTPIVLPALGESVTEGTVTRWLKGVGDNVVVDEPLLEVSTDKVDTEIPSPATGVLISIAVPADATAAVGATLGMIAGGGTGAAPAAPAAPIASPAPTTAAASPAPTAASAPSAAPAPTPPTSVLPTPAPITDAYVTPLVRKLAAENNVNLETLTGTGVGGRIRKQDVLDAAARAKGATAPATSAAAAPAAAPAAPAVSPLRGRTEPMSRLRKVIATRMVESLQTTAQLTSVCEVDVTNIVSLRAKHKQAFESREGVGLSFMPFFLKGLVDVLKSHPVLNAEMNLEKGEITYHDAEHIGIAVDTPRGLLVPVIRDAGDLSFAGLARKTADLAERTRNGQVSPDELSGGTFTLTNTGSRGALFDTPIVNMPQAAILGLGQIVKRPIVVTDDAGRDLIAIRHMVFLSLSYDHRLVDGADAARFLTDLKHRYENGSFEL